MKGERCWKRLDWIRRNLSFDGGSQSGIYQTMVYFHWLNHLQGVGLLEENMKDIMIVSCINFWTIEVIELIFEKK